VFRKRRTVQSLIFDFRPIKVSLFKHFTPPLPLSVMHPHKWTQEDDLNRFSLALCDVMARDCKDEKTRRVEFSKHQKFLVMQVEYHIDQTSPLETHSARADLRISALGKTILQRSSWSSILASHICKSRSPIRRSYMV